MLDQLVLEPFVLVRVGYKNLQSLRGRFSWRGGETHAATSPTTDDDLALPDQFSLYSAIERFFPAKVFAQRLVGYQSLFTFRKIFQAINEDLSEGSFSAWSASFPCYLCLGQKILPSISLRQNLALTAR